MGIRIKIKQAMQILQAVGMPKEQHNERSALCLLALLDLDPQASWADARNPLLGITPIMDWIKENYRRDYAPNTREIFRRYSMHQFVEAGIAVYNPDDPLRPINSPKTVYQAQSDFLRLIQSFGEDVWVENLAEYLSQKPSLVEKYAKHRQQVKIPVKIREGLTLELSSGAHSTLIKDIIEEFAPRFASGSKLVYIGDTGNKSSYLDKELLNSLGVFLDDHGKMPDVVLYSEKDNWLFLIESVTSHGPVDSKRFNELETLFENIKIELVYVTALPSRNMLTKFLSAIAWETEVWVAESPSHLIHFNGDQFLGPHKKF